MTQFVLTNHANVEVDHNHCQIISRDALVGSTEYGSLVTLDLGTYEQHRVLFCVYEKTTAGLSKVEQKKIIFDVNFILAYANNNELETVHGIPLSLITQKSREALNHPSIHSLRASSPERQLLSTLANLERRTFLIPEGKNWPQIFIIMLAALSSFTMADIPLSMIWLVMAMMGAGLFNLIGGVTYPGLEKPWDKDDSWTTAFHKFFGSSSFWNSFAGVASAVSPAKLTYSGVIQLGYDPALAFCSMISNFLLSGTLGAVGVSKVVENIKNFYRGGYSPIVAREIELLIYTLLALVLTSARSYAVGQMIYDGDEWKKLLGAYGLSTLLNIPETLMFITAFTGLRIKIHEALQARNFPNTFISLVSFMLAILFAISFFKSFVGLTEQSWLQCYSTWFDAQGITWLNQIVSNSGGLAAALLVVGEGSTIEATMRYLYQFTTQIPSKAGAVGASVLGCINKVIGDPRKLTIEHFGAHIPMDLLPLSEETTVLIPDDMPAPKNYGAATSNPFILGTQSINQNSIAYSFFGTVESYAAIQRAQVKPADSCIVFMPDIEPGSYTGFSIV